MLQVIKTGWNPPLTSSFHLGTASSKNMPFVLWNNRLNKSLRCMTLWLFLEKNKVIKFSAIQFPTRKSVEESYILQVKLHEAEATCLLGPLPFVSFKFKDLVAEQHPSNVGTTSSSKLWSSSYSGRYGRGPIDWDKVRVIFIQKVSIVHLAHFLSTRQRQKISLHVHWMLEGGWWGGETDQEVMSIFWFFGAALVDTIWGSPV